MNALKKVWGRKTSQELGKKQKEDEYIQAKFHNYENPQKSFSIDSRNPESIFYRGSREKKKINNGTLPNFGYIGEVNGNKIPFDSRNFQNVYITENHATKNPFFGLKAQNIYYNENTKKDTPFIKQKKQVMKSKELRKKSGKSISEASFFAESSSIVLSEPKKFTWKDREAYIYKVESKSNKHDDKKRDFEFVIYIPIDTAVKWLSSPSDKENTKAIKEKSPDYVTEQATSSPITERATNEAPERNIKYGVEQDSEKKSYLIEEWKRESAIGSTSDEDDDDKQPDQAEEMKVKKKKIVKKKPRKIITTYEIEEDTVSLGGLRPKQKKEPTKIIGSDKVF